MNDTHHHNGERICSSVPRYTVHSGKAKDHQVLCTTTDRSAAFTIANAERAMVPEHTPVFVEVTS